MKTINLSVADDTYMRLSASAAYKEMSINAYCEKILRDSQRPTELPKPNGEQYQPTDEELNKYSQEEIEEYLKSSKASNPFLYTLSGDPKELGELRKKWRK